MANMMQEDHSEIEKLSLKETVEDVLQESRMILPGVQALFGFQLIAFFNSAYANLDQFNRLVHLIALGLTILSIGLLMAPVAYHRQVERQTVSKGMIKYATSLITVGMAPLAASIGLDVYVVSGLALNHNSTVSAVASISTVTFLIIFWYVLPQYFKNQREEQKESNTARALSGQ